ncbi:protein-L-isoaspartate(D-aspartate) O-methyltransferase [Crossiella equi]|uniref:Protein-L-isoaspartate O-methyltransferase n=1 Tax=Crossiella equi TaxID=130796 RepID=A0ABS5AKY3_9PSEU|nr:methyltransferase domain-containing protein [Crossiella equi]MBP2477221.1 protein-L-isoaspartate(D-aspartate) O-methyltransferase [Crossiella equi]
MRAHSQAGEAVLAAFAQVDRGDFVPDRVWCSVRGNLPVALDRRVDGELWREAVYGDTVVVTQFDDGRTRWPEVGRVATSSASQPRLVVDMLAHLDLAPGMRVLEVGAGTGYNAALLAALTGPGTVTTVELDPVLAELAEANLRRAGADVEVVCGDGALGVPARAPFDRVVATVAVVGDGLPYAWAEQTRPGGVILTPWGTAYDNGVLLHLVVRPDGSASGPVVGGVAFMQLRAQRLPVTDSAELVHNLYARRARGSEVPPDEVALGEGVFAIGVRLPDVRCEVTWTGRYDHEVLLADPASGSGALAEVRDGVVEVRETGPRALWAEAEAAHAWWVARGRPGLHRFGVTLTREGHRVWLDTEAEVVSPGPPRR